MMFHEHHHLPNDDDFTLFHLCILNTLPVSLENSYSSALAKGKLLRFLYANGPTAEWSKWYTDTCISDVVLAKWHQTCITKHYYTE